MAKNKKEKEQVTKMPGFVLDMKGIGKLVDEGTYPVVLTNVTHKKTAKGADMITMQATIRDSDTEFDGKTLFRNFVFDPNADTEKLNNIKFFLQRAFLAFGADIEDLQEDTFNPVEYGVSMKGAKSEAKVTHVPNSQNPDQIMANVEFVDPGF